MIGHYLFSAKFITNRLDVLPFLRKCCKTTIIIMWSEIAWPRVTFLTGRVLQAACREVNRKQCDVTFVCAITSCNRGVHPILALLLTTSWNVNPAVNVRFCVSMQNSNFTMYVFESFTTAATLGTLAGRQRCWLELGRYFAADSSHSIVVYLVSDAYHTSSLGDLLADAGEPPSFMR
jgi:uncharacterized membrane protein YoaK (UPF0700 family)